MTLLPLWQFRSFTTVLSIKRTFSLEAFFLEEEQIVIICERAFRRSISFIMSIDFPKEEESVLEHWREINAFQRQVCIVPNS